MNNRLFHINVLDHPTNRNMTVYFFTENDHSEYFKGLLREHKMSYEFEIDEASGKFYFGIDKRLQHQARKLNYLVFARYRKPFIPNAVARTLLLVITVSVILLAVISALKS